MGGKICSTDDDESICYNKKCDLCLDTTLSKLNRILDTDHFALVVHKQRIYTTDMAVEEQEVIVGIVTDIDLLQYISRAEQGSGSVSLSRVASYILSHFPNCPPS